MIRFGGPLVVGMAAHALFNRMDLFLVSRIPNVGTEAIVAVSWVSILQMVPMVIGNGIATDLVANAYGQGKHSRCLRAISQSLLLLVLLSLVTGIIGVGWPRELCRVFGLQRSLTGTWKRFHVDHVSRRMEHVSYPAHDLGSSGAGEGNWPMILLIGANRLNLILAIAYVLAFRRGS